VHVTTEVVAVHAGVQPAVLVVLGLDEQVDDVDPAGFDVLDAQAREERRAGYS